MATHSAHYWAVDFPRLTEDQANDLVQRASEMGIQGFTVDPIVFLTTSMDRATVETLSAAISEKMEAEPLFEVVQEWLADTDRPAR